MRYPRGSGVGVPLAEEGWEPLPIGKAEVLRSGGEVLILAYGSMVHPSLQAAEILKEHGISATVVNARFAKPLDTELILPLAEQSRLVVTVEEGCLMGGFGSAVAEALLDADLAVPLLRLGVPDVWVEHATPEESLAELGLNSAGIAERIRAKFQARVLKGSPAELPTVNS
jgi:1-deoxy-D-xylulose-5-phosphate synthase